MDIDNSMAAAFRRCEYEYFESYEREGTGIEPKPFPGERYSPLQFGSRAHELLENHYCEMGDRAIKVYPSSTDEALEIEAQIMLAGYRTHYPVEYFKVIDVENNFRVQLPGSHHFYLGKIDLILEEKPGILDI